MRIFVPVADAGPPARPSTTPRQGAIGVIDNSKPRFDVLARSALAELKTNGFTHDDSDYVRKSSPTRPAALGEIERLSNGTVAVLIGSGD